MKIFEQLLLKKLPDYAAEGLIDPDSRARLDAYLQAQVRAGSAMWWWVLYVLGGILVSVGAILLVRNNWYEFSPATRLFLGAVPFLVSVGLGVWTLARRQDSLWAVFVPLLNIAGVMCAIAVTAQVYQLPPNMHLFLRVVLILVMPLPFLFRTQLVPAVCLVLLSFWAGDVRQMEELWAPLFFCAHATLMFAFILRPYGKGGAPFQWLAAAISLVAVCIGLPQVWESFDVPDKPDFRLYYPAMALYLSGIFLWHVHCARRGRNGWGSEAVLRWAGIVFFTILLLMAGCRYGWRLGEMRPFWQAGTDVWSWLGLAVLSLAALFNTLWLCRIGWRRDEYLPYLVAALAGVFAPLFLAAGAFPEFLEGVLKYGANALYIAVVVCFLLDGIRRRRYAPLNTGIAMLLLFVWVRMMEHDFSLLIQAATFISLGIFLIAMNVWLNRLRKKEVAA